LGDAAAFTARKFIRSGLQKITPAPFARTREDAMGSFTWFAAGIAETLLLTTHIAPAATLSGTITGPDKAAFRCPFVRVSRWVSLRSTHPTRYVKE
jgi:hypothetical protein